VAERNRTPVVLGLSLSTPSGPLMQAAYPGAESAEANRSPYSSPGSIETRLELVRRQAQAWLDGTLGAGQGLALVDGDVRQLPQVVQPGVENHFIRARDESEGKRAPNPNDSAIKQILKPEYSTVLVLVGNGRAGGVQAKLSRLPELEQTLQLKLDGRDSRRMVVLP